MTHYRTDDVRIEQGDELLAPMQVMRELPATERTETTTFDARRAIHDILRGADDRLLVVVGPCSILTSSVRWWVINKNRQSWLAVSLDSVGLLVRLRSSRPPAA